MSQERWREFTSAERKEFSRLQQTNWWVITGGPSTDKSTLLDCLSRRGYKTMPEAARTYIDAQRALGKTMKQIRADDRKFQVAVLRLKEEWENQAPVNELILWDRGLHGDSGAYWLREKPKYDPADMFEPDEVTIQTRRYKGIFLLDRLPYRRDYARVENETKAARLHYLIGQMYRLLGYAPIRVPVMPGKDEEEQVNNRATFVIDQMKKIDPSVPDLPLPPRE